MTQDPDCIFCKIVAGEIPCLKLYEDGDTLAFMDINPANPGHCLAIVKDHHPTLFDIPEPALGKVAATAKRIAKAVNDTLAPDGLNLVQANGPGALNSVPHLHLHILPRYTGDDLKLNWGVNPGNLDDIQEIAEKVRAVLG